MIGSFLGTPAGIKNQPMIPFPALAMGGYGDFAIIILPMGLHSPIVPVDVDGDGDGLINAEGMEIIIEWVTGHFVTSL